MPANEIDYISNTLHPESKVAGYHFFSMNLTQNEVKNRAPDGMMEQWVMVKEKC
jgi:hypothetical protein